MITISASALPTTEGIIAIEGYAAGSVLPQMFDVESIEELPNGCIRVTFPDGGSDTFHPLGWATVSIAK